MSLDRTKKHVAGGCEWSWDDTLEPQWYDKNGQWLNEDTFLLLNPVPIEEMETITMAITATFDEIGGCAEISGCPPDYSCIGDAVRLIMLGDRDGCTPVRSATAEITVVLTRPKR